MTDSNKGSRANYHLCEYCRDLFDYYSDERECFVCDSKDGLYKMWKSGLILCEKHRREQKKINQSKYARKYTRAHSISTKDLTPDEKRQITKSVLCQYFFDLKERERELSPVCVECGSEQDIVSVITKKGLKLLCPQCRAKIYQCPKRKRFRTSIGYKCDWCDSFGARKIRGVDLYLCPDHFMDYEEEPLLEKETNERSSCDRCDCTNGIRKLYGHRFCSKHLEQFLKEKKEIDPVLRIFIIPFIRT
jgi:hypothetical protein